jgi:hypothetical protein
MVYNCIHLPADELSRTDVADVVEPALSAAEDDEWWTLSLLLHIGDMGLGDISPPLRAALREEEDEDERFSRGELEGRRLSGERDDDGGRRRRAARCR